jgi:hypothetical protein
LPQATIEQLIGRSNKTIVDWFNLCRDVCVEMFDRREQMAGPGHHVEIDEALLTGKRKYNRERLLRSNLPA